MSKVEALAMRTLGAREALALARRLRPAVRARPQAEAKVLDVRNAAAHMGYVTPEELRQAVLHMTQVVDDLLRALGEDREAFWGQDLLDSVDAMLDEAANATKKRVLLAMAIARAHLDRRVSGVAADQRAPLLALLAAAGSRWQATPEGAILRQQCPVCHQDGYLNVDIDTDLADDGWPPVTAYEDRTGWPLVFDCPVCGLDLSGEELAEVDGFPESVELKARDDVDLRDYAAEFLPEPDED